MNLLGDTRYWVTFKRTFSEPLTDRDKAVDYFGRLYDDLAHVTSLSHGVVSLSDTDGVTFSGVVHARNERVATRLAEKAFKKAINMTGEVPSLPPQVMNGKPTDDVLGKLDRIRQLST